MKGVILNAGNGKRLAPITKCISKGLVPVYDRPALMYHISFFASMGIRELAIVISEEHEKSYRDFLRQIDTQGIDISLYVQKEGAGVLAAYVSCADFTKGNNIVMVMGDCLYFIDDVINLKKQAEACFESDKVGIVQGKAKPGANAAFFERNQNDGTLSYDYRTAGENEICPIGMHFIPKSLTGSIEDFIQPSFTELDAAAVSTRLIQSERLMLPELTPNDEWFDIGTAEQLFLAGAYVRDKNR
ncbi:MAG: sugar nucleotidyltransferase [Clostridiales bacterium]|nr:sugar nucleotidyltransferase [Candidatus Cacconaster stercorequi]